MARLNWLLPIVFLETPGDGAGGGAGAAGSANGGGSTANNPGAGTQGTSAAAGDPSRTGAGTSGTSFTYTEDRSRWIPPHRLNEESTKRTQAETQLRELQAKYADVEKRMQILAGVTPQDPRTTKQAAVKEAFFEMFPQFRKLAELSEEQFNTLLQTPQHVQAATQAEQRYWSRHGDQMVSQAGEQIAEAFGAESLTPRQANAIKTNFREWLESTVLNELNTTGGQSSTLDAYEKGDPSVVASFVKQYTEDWVAPARRAATSQHLTRARSVPDSRGRSQQTTVERPEKFASLDERIEYAAKVAKSRGASFNG